MRAPVQIDPETMTDAELGEVYAMRVAAKLEVAPDEPARTVPELIARARHSPEMERSYTRSSSRRIGAGAWRVGSRPSPWSR